MQLKSSSKKLLAHFKRYVKVVKVKFIIYILFFLGVFTSVNAGEQSLPPLTSVDFISGRTASESDVNMGKAVFVLKDGEIPIGNPINIKLPQYAIFIDNGNKIPVIVIQAEKARGKRLLGSIDISGSAVVGFYNDFELLGDTKP